MRKTGVIPWLAAILSAVSGGEGPDLAEVTARSAAYVVETQAADGSWGRGLGRAGVTALAVEALLAVPEAEQSEAMRGACRRGAVFLASSQQGAVPFDGAIFEAGGMAVSTYSTALAIGALRGVDAEIYAPAIARAAGWLRRQQATEDQGGYDPALHPHAYGGFAYGVGGGARGSRPDLSNSWMALHALRASGTVDPDDPVWARALRFVQRCQHSSETNDMPWASDSPDQVGAGVYFPAVGLAGGNGGQGGGAPAGYGTMTCALILSYLSAGLAPGDSRLDLAVEWLDRRFDVEEVPNQGQDGLYYYYRILAKTLAELGRWQAGDHSRADRLARALATRQREDGSFVNGSADRWQENDPALVTAYALAALGEARRAMAAGEHGGRNGQKDGE